MITSTLEAENIIHRHSVEQITGLNDFLDCLINDIIGLQSSLNSKANDVHEHVIVNITGVQNELNNKANIMFNSNSSSTTVVGNSDTVRQIC